MAEEIINSVPNIEMYRAKEFRYFGTSNVLKFAVEPNDPDIDAPILE